MRSSDLTYIALVLMAFVVASGLFFYIGVSYGTGTIGSYQVAKVVVPLDSEADDLRDELEGLMAEKKQLVAELAELTGERNKLTAASDAVRAERDELLALLAGTEKRLAAADGIPPAPTLAAATPDSADSAGDAPALITAAGPENASRPQIATLPSSTDDDDVALFEDQVIYPAGGNKPPLGLQAPAKPMRQGDVTAVLETGLAAFKDGDYRKAYETWLPLAEAGVRRAQFYVGGLFRDGRGVEADLVRAHFWLSLSDQAGYPLAHPLLTEVEAQMSPQQRATARSLLAGQQAAGSLPTIEYR